MPNKLLKKWTEAADMCWLTVVVFRDLSFVPKKSIDSFFFENSLCHTYFWFFKKFTRNTFSYFYDICHKLTRGKCYFQFSLTDMWLLKHLSEPGRFSCFITDIKFGKMKKGDLFSVKTSSWSKRIRWIIILIWFCFRHNF